MKKTVPFICLIVLLFVLTLTACSSEAAVTVAEEGLQVFEDLETADNFTSCATTNLDAFVEDEDNWEIIGSVILELKDLIDPVPFSAIRRKLFTVPSVATLEEVERFLIAPEEYEADEVGIMKTILKDIFIPSPYPETTIRVLTSTALCDMIHNTHKLSFQPYFIPIKVSIDQNGDIKLEAELAVPTPIGIISFSSEAELVELFPNNRLLIIYIDNDVTVYELEQDKEYSFAFDPNTGSAFIEFRQDENNNAILMFRSTQGN
ncbi:hypothetical protein MNBD_CHLOROFLEXI01-4346 [hydrothermal vent metagenome]|uniref:Lipoprotein n=1 Tax=hydrothermal vent metagenome TaxID=652676 RepID=A0A3B0VWZ2_9ZZZZ